MLTILMGETSVKSPTVGPGIRKTSFSWMKAAKVILWSLYRIIPSKYIPANNGCDLGYFNHIQIFYPPGEF